jgi:polyisoprenoid-binding protein YceI
MKAMTSFAAMLLTASLSVSALAADPAKVEAGSYAIEPNHTRVLFSVDHMGFSTYYGEFTATSGTLDLKNPDAAGSTLAISIQTGSVSTSNAKLDGELKDADWFDAAKFPAITFKSTSVKPTGPDTADVAGDLTLHGVTKPVTLKVKLHGAGQNPMTKKTTIGFDVTGAIDRTDFGVSKYAPLIGKEVDLMISAAFEKQG